jgi:HPt (histidine-containing phosphotransfer) domain-containing protein
MRIARSARMHTAETPFPVLDDSVIAELQTLGANVVAEIFELFVTDVPNRLGKLQQAIETRSRDGILREAHGLKGSALGVGASRLAVLCAAIEHDARDGHLDQAAARSSELEGQFAQVRGAIKDRGVIR